MFKLDEKYVSEHSSPDEMSGPDSHEGSPTVYRIRSSNIAF